MELIIIAISFMSDNNSFSSSSSSSLLLLLSLSSKLVEVSSSFHYHLNCYFTVILYHHHHNHHLSIEGGVKGFVVWRSLGFFSLIFVVIKILQFRLFSKFWWNCVNLFFFCVCVWFCGFVASSLLMPQSSMPLFHKGLFMQATHYHYHHHYITYHHYHLVIIIIDI